MLKRSNTVVRANRFAHIVVYYKDVLPAQYVFLAADVLDYPAFGGFELFMVYVQVRYGFLQQLLHGVHAFGEHRMRVIADLLDLDLVEVTRRVNNNRCQLLLGLRDLGNKLCP